ncbi:peptide-methionine (R)-S-oxide reductase MsrB [Kangiella marina]|uniref:peptide-methionine (R)-S-oxide reductase n=1 Tax=Kangiella marina TaxID=1079178 RepID=A0ABP8IL67_9GAMM
MNWRDVISLVNDGNPEPPRVVGKTAAEWQKLLSAEEYRVMRQKGTERAFSGEHCNVFEPGVYGCASCGEPLFDSSHKFESGTGWPSFGEPVKPGVVRYNQDRSYGMTRVEVSCNVCGGHLGHVFPDGPAPSGLRFCVNSVSLQKLEDHSDES